MNNILVILCGVFYSVLCVFSIVTGQMYASGKKELNPLELSEKTLAKLDDKDKLSKFTIRMGWITFFVGLVQGLTAYALFKRGNAIYYFIALGFTIFSILSASFKLKGKINAFPVIKLIFYTIVFIVLLLNNTRALFF